MVNGIQHFFGGMAVEAVGGGWGLVDFLFRSAERNAIPVRYNTALRKLIQNRKGEITGVTVFGPDGYEDIAAKSVVLACGGFEADPEMRVRYYGPGWEMAKVRGTRHNTGDGIKAALEIGAAAFGGWSSCHAVQWDISSPPFGDRVVLDNYQKHSYPIGIMVNANGERFVDEGRRLPQLHLCQVRPRGDEAAAAHGGADLRPEDDQDGARRIPHPSGNEGRGQHAGGAGREAGDQRRRPGAHGGGVQRGVPAGRLQSGDPGRQVHQGHHAAQVELGAADRPAAIQRVRRSPAALPSASAG